MKEEERNRRIVRGRRESAATESKGDSENPEKQTRK